MAGGGGGGGGGRGGTGGIPHNSFNIVSSSTDSLHVWRPMNVVMLLKDAFGTLSTFHKNG